MAIIFLIDMVSLFAMGIALGVLKPRGRLAARIYALTTTAWWCFFL